MKNKCHKTLLSAFIIGVTTSLLSSLSPVQQLHALPFVKVGPVVGYGTGIIDEAEGVDQTFNNFAFGVSALLDIPVIKLEVDFLYMNSTLETQTTQGMMTVTSDTQTNLISIPLIVRYNLSPIPLFDLGFGGGYERRFNLDDEDSDEAEFNYVPLSVRADFSVPMLASVGVEGRFSYHLADDPIHEAMLFVHAAF